MQNNPCAAKKAFVASFHVVGVQRRQHALRPLHSVRPTTTLRARPGLLRLVEPPGALPPVSVRYLRTSRIHLPASLGSTGITPLQRYYGRSDFSMAGSSCRRGDNEHRHDAMEISLLHVHGLPTIPPPTTPRRPAIALTRYPSAWRASRSGSRLRQLPAGSPQTQGRIAFVILRTGRSPPVAPHDASRRRSYIRFQAGERVPGGGLPPP